MYENKGGGGGGGGGGGCGESIGESIYYMQREEESQPQHQHTWIFRLQIWKRTRNQRHQLLGKYAKPTISASTTATNLSEYQSSTTLFKNRMATLEENLRISQPEIEPLNAKEKDLTTVESAEDENLPKWETFSTCEKLRITSRQLLTALIVSWLSMVIGYTSAYTSPADKSLRRDFNIGEDEMSWVGGLMPLGAVLGGLLGGPSIEHLGRKLTLVITDVFFLVAWAVNYFAKDYHYLYISRSLVGCGVGFASLTFPVYLGETMQPELRGTLGLLPTTFGNFGILLCFLLGNLFEWRDLAGIAFLLSIPFLAIFIWVIPETPRWYISKDKLEECRNTLVWLRGKKQDITKEFDDLVRSQKEQSMRNEGTMSDMFTKATMKPLMICLSLMLFQQFTGINAVIFYTTKIFEASGSTLPPLVCTTIIGAVNMISTFVANALIDKLGRKVLLYLSSCSMVVCLTSLGTYYYFKDVMEADVTQYGYIPLASLIIFALGFSLGMGPIPWLMMGEILPAKVRGPAASIATAFNWTSTFVITKTFPIMIANLGFCTTFWFYGVMVGISVIFTVICVPETRGRSLEDIERLLAGHKVRRISSVANIKPLPSTF